MTDSERKIIKFLEDPKNWRPPSYTQIMRHMGYKSKNSVARVLKKIKWGGLKPKTGQRIENSAYTFGPETTGDASTDSNVGEIRITKLKKAGYSAPIFINDIKRR